MFFNSSLCKSSISAAIFLTYLFTILLMLLLIRGFQFWMALLNRTCLTTDRGITSIHSDCTEMMLCYFCSIYYFRWGNWVALVKVHISIALDVHLPQFPTKFGKHIFVSSAKWHCLIHRSCPNTEIHWQLAYLTPKFQFWSLIFCVTRN